MTIAQLNAADRASFVGAVGFAFEDSPWIAEAVWERRPFADLDSLVARMIEIVVHSPEECRVALIAAHPDLAGRLAREGRLTAAMRGEQDSAGLDHLSADELGRFDALNAAYRARFGFPFVICARENTKESILAAMDSRAAHDRPTEVATALVEIAKIARLRLRDALDG